MAIVNFVNSFSNFLVPSVISFFKTPERTIFFCGFSYLYLLLLSDYVIDSILDSLHILFQLSPILCVLYMDFCLLYVSNVDFDNQMVWACQGIILGNNSTDEDRGTKSGMFMAIYMFGSVFELSHMF